MSTDKSKMNKKKEMKIVLKSKSLGVSDAKSEEFKIHPKKRIRDVKLKGTRG